jgi:hypothetical protein
MNFLKISVIIDGRIIYPVEKEKSLIIPVEHNYPSVVATDGYHVTLPVQLSYRNSNTCHLTLLCAVDDDQFSVGIVVLLLFAVVGVVSDIFIMMLISFIPIFYFLFYYYIKRKDFLRIRLA